MRRLVRVALSDKSDVLYIHNLSCGFRQTAELLLCEKGVVSGVC